MKLLREYIRALLIEDTAGPVVPKVGDVLDAIEMIKKAEKTGRKKDIMSKLSKKVGLELAKSLLGPVGTAIKGVKGTVDLYKTFKDVPDKKAKDNPLFDMLDIDDQYQKMLDDRVEDAFDNFIIPILQGLDRDSPLPDINVTLEKWLKSNFDDRGISGR